jgi:hypothetical protein
MDDFVLFETFLNFPNFLITTCYFMSKKYILKAKIICSVYTCLLEFYIVSWHVKDTGGPGIEI